MSFAEEHEENVFTAKSMMIYDENLTSALYMPKPSVSPVHMYLDVRNPSSY